MSMFDLHDNTQLFGEYRDQGQSGGPLRLIGLHISYMKVVRGISVHTTLLIPHSKALTKYIFPNFDNPPKHAGKGYLPPE